jgi:hypothetical protein
MYESVKLNSIYNKVFHLKLRSRFRQEVERMSKTIQNFNVDPYDLASFYEYQKQIIEFERMQSIEPCAQTVY